MRERVRRLVYRVSRSARGKAEERRKVFPRSQVATFSSAPVVGRLNLRFHQFVLKGAGE